VVFARRFFDFINRKGVSGIENQQEYLLLFNAVTDAIEEVEAIIYKSEKLVQRLKRIQRQSEELYINESDNEK